MGRMGHMGWPQLLVMVATLGGFLGCTTDETQPPKPDLQQMTRWWHFGRMRVGGTTEESVGAEQVQIGGSLNQSMDFGGLVLFPPGAGPNAKAELFSNETGKTYWAYTEAPNATLTDGAVIGSSAHLHQFQVYRKRDSNATLRLVVSKTFLEAIDGNPNLPSAIECPWHNPGGSFADCARITLASANYSVTAFSYLDQKTILKTGGGAQLFGWRGAWDYEAYTTFGATGSFWDRGSFTFDPDVDDVGGGHAALSLDTPITINVPLDSVQVGNDFYVSAKVDVLAWNHRQRESYLAAYFRDPVAANGLEFEFTGIDPIETPLEKPEEPVPASAPACNGGPNGGTIQFAAPSFETPELLLSGGTVMVTRTGGTSGPVSATLTTTNGSAIAGTDYTAVSTIVYFADGEGNTRGVQIPILNDDDAEADKSLTLTLSAPVGCASLGSQSTATLKILDDDRPIIPPETFTVGGTVTGLAGSGLVLTNLGATVTPTGDGHFVFPTEYPDGILYEVRITTQPTNPDQVCSVAHGSGNISAADISDVAVICVTQQTNGDLDPSYGQAGKVTSGLVGGALDIVIQTDGKAILLGERAMARYNTDGTLDQSFGTGGNVPIPFNGGLLDNALGLTLQPDGKIVVVGTSKVGTQDDFAIARYTSAGQLDGSFGSGGNVFLDFGGQVDRAYAALILPSGDIVVAGHAARPVTAGFDNDFAVARLTGSGVLDSAFGTNGKVTTNIAGRTDLAFAAALQNDGKILVAGRVADGGGDDPDVGIVRYNSDGSPDSSFGALGILRRNLTGNWDEVSDMVIQPDGRIVVAVQGVVGANFDYMVARFETGGSLDQSFGNQGVASTGFGAQNDFAKSIALQSNGMILIAGNVTLISQDFGVARFDTHGVLDPSFGTGGKVTVDFFGASDGAEALALQGDGRILAGGVARNGTQTGIGLVRIIP